MNLRADSRAERWIVRAVGAVLTAVLSGGVLWAGWTTTCLIDMRERIARMEQHMAVGEHVATRMD